MIMRNPKHTWVKRLPRLRIHAFSGILAFALCVTFGQVHAQFKSKSVEIFADRKPIAEFLREFAAKTNVDIFVEPSLTGTVSGVFKGAPASVLNEIGRMQRLLWYFEANGALQIVGDADLRTEFVSYSDLNPKTLQKSLNKMGLLDSKFPIVVFPDEGTIRISGPKNYVELIRKQIAALGSSDNIASNQQEVRVFPLKYVFANDTKISSGTIQSLVPGLASVLQQIYSRDTSVGQPTRQRAGLVPPAAGRVTSSTVREGEIPKTLVDGLTDTGSTGRNNQQGGARGPVFVADVRQNAIIVKDNADRMSMHAKLIESLDKPSSLVEIDIKIIEVTSNMASQLGIDWRLNGPKVDFQSGRGALPSLTYPATQQPSYPGTAAELSGGLFTLLSGNALRSLILRVNALIDTGHARVESSPKILTMANLQALMESKEEVSVRVAGNLEANLYTVSAGTAMRVTPIVSAIGGVRAISMAIELEDGTLDARTVDNIPVVRRNTISTQATVIDGESLLIAGYSKDVVTETESGVPLLKDIVGFGNLFKSTSKSRQRVERLVLLTPRAIDSAMVKRND
jgi:type III secretion protein C